MIKNKDFYSFLIKVEDRNSFLVNNAVSYFFYSWLLKEVEKFDSKLSNTIHASSKPYITVGDFFQIDESDNNSYSRITCFGKEIFDILIKIFDNDNNCIRIKNKKFKIFNSFTDFVENDSIVTKSDINKFLEIKNKNNIKEIKASFLTPVFFKKQNKNYILPEPQILFTDLAKKWNEIKIDPIDIDLLAKKSAHIYFSDVEIKSDTRVFKNIKQIGFTGKIKFHLDDVSEDFRGTFAMLSEFGFYTGIGSKTTYGFGQYISEIIE
ncbi:MAG: CRISPR system precrRNA processing endoribonuclease RAMP protein Cas6 [Candidatus Muiribacteriota bacterium]